MYILAVICTCLSWKLKFSLDVYIKFPHNTYIKLSNAEFEILRMIEIISLKFMKKDLV